MISTKQVAAATALLLTVALTACGTQDGAAPGDAAAPATSTVSAGSFADADVQFAQEMIVHHRGALEMARLAPDRAKDPQVVALAERIEAAQAPELDAMTSWLQSWGQTVPDDVSMTEMSMPGMMTVEQMSQLTDSRGADFDRLFLELMTAHHQGAVDMARTEQEAGKSPDAVALAETIETDQTAEIAEMQRLLRRLAPAAL